MTEMLVVMGIIAVLSAVVFPVYFSVRNSMRGASCASNLHQLYQAASLYDQEWGRLPGAGLHNPGDRNNEKPGGHWVWIDPSGVSAATPAVVERGGLYRYLREPRVYQCDADPDAQAKKLSYSMNQFCSRRKMERARHPATTWLFVHEQHGKETPGSGGLNDGWFGWAPDDLPTRIHDRGTNIITLSGRAKHIRITATDPDGIGREINTRENMEF